VRDAGWSVEEIDCPPFREAARLQAILWLSEFRRGAESVLREEAEADSVFVYEQMTELCPEPDLNGVMDALQMRVTLTRHWQLFLHDYPVLLCPVSAELPFPDLLDVESPAAFRRVMEAQLTQVGLPLMGLPGLTVTTGLVGATPVGVQLVGGRYREDILLEAGTIIEAAGCPASPVDPA
jgi:amidase